MRRMAKIILLQINFTRSACFMCYVVSFCSGILNLCGKKILPAVKTGHLCTARGVRRAADAFKDSATVAPNQAAPRVALGARCKGAAIPGTGDRTS